MPCDSQVVRQVEVNVVTFVTLGSGYVVKGRKATWGETSEGLAESCLSTRLGTTWEKHFLNLTRRLIMQNVSCKMDQFCSEVHLAPPEKILYTSTSTWPVWVKDPSHTLSNGPTLFWGEFQVLIDEEKKMTCWEDTRENARIRSGSNLHQNIKSNIVSLFLKLLDCYYTITCCSSSPIAMHCVYKAK